MIREIRKRTRKNWVLRERFPGNMMGKPNGNGKADGAGRYAPSPHMLDEMLRAKDPGVIFRRWRRDMDQRLRDRPRVLPPHLEAGEAEAWVHAEKAIEHAEAAEDSDLLWGIVALACVVHEKLGNLSRLRARDSSIRALPEPEKEELQVLLQAVDQDISARTGTPDVQELPPEERQDLAKLISRARVALAEAMKALLE